VINERFRETLESSKIYFASPEQLNDPFDCQIDLLRTRILAQGSSGKHTSKNELEAWAHLAQDIEAKARTCGVFSLCGGDLKGEKEQLFWSHYADNHKGLCVTYEIPTSFVLEQMIGISPVSYNTANLFNALTSLDLRATPDFVRDVHPIIQHLLTTKSQVWSYESEFRLIASQAGLVEIDRSFLKQICFGLRTPDEQKEEIITCARSFGYHSCIFAEVYVPSSGIFALDTREIIR
jgi:hypothetical protein